MVFHRGKQSSLFHHIPIGHRYGDDGLLQQPIEQHVPRVGSSAIEAGAAKVYLASAAPPVRYPNVNVYGIDMPTQSELIAHGCNVDEIAACIDCDTLIYQDVSGMKEAIRKLNPAISNFEASCFVGAYITGDVVASDATRINAGRMAEENADAATRLTLHNV